MPSRCLVRMTFVPPKNNNYDDGYNYCGCLTREMFITRQLHKLSCQMSAMKAGMRMEYLWKIASLPFYRFRRKQISRNFIAWCMTENLALCKSLYSFNQSCLNLLYCVVFSSTATKLRAIKIMEARLRIVACAMRPVGQAPWAIECLSRLNLSNV